MDPALAQFLDERFKSGWADLSKHIDSKFHDIENRINATFVDMENRAAANIETKFVDMETRLDAKMETKFEAMDKRIDSRFKDMDAKFDNMDAKLNNMDSKLNNLDISIKATDIYISVIVHSRSENEWRKKKNSATVAGNLLGRLIPLVDVKSGVEIPDFPETLESLLSFNVPDLLRIANALGNGHKGARYR